MLTRTSAAPLAAGRELFQGTACEMRCFLRAGSGRLRGASPAESGAGGRASPGHGLRPQQAAVPVPLPTAARTKGQQPASPELPGPPLTPGAGSVSKAETGNWGLPRATPALGLPGGEAVPEAERPTEGGTLHSSCLSAPGSSCGFSGTSRILLSQNRKWGLEERKSKQAEILANV